MQEMARALPGSRRSSLRHVRGFPLSATALKKLQLSRNLLGDLPSQAVGPGPACRVHVCGNKSLQA